MRYHLPHTEIYLVHRYAKQKRPTAVLLGPLDWADKIWIENEVGGMDE